MTEPEQSIALENTPHRSRNVRRILLGLTCAALLVLFGIGRTNRSRLDQQLLSATAERTAAENTLNNLTEDVRRLQQAKEAAEFQTDQIRQVISWCDEPTDCWRNESPFCIAHVATSPHMNSNVRLLVPSGKHTLHFRMEKKGDAVATEPTDRKFVLPGPAAYLISLKLPREKDIEYRAPRQLLLGIESSESEFEVINQPLLDQPIPPPSGGVTSGSHPRHFPIFFPNQVSYRDKELPRGVILNQMRWTIRPTEKDRFDLHFRMELVSEGPKVANVKDAQRFKSRPNSPKLKYVGKGKYELNP